MHQLWAPHRAPSPPLASPGCKQCPIDFWALSVKIPIMFASPTDDRLHVVNFPVYLKKIKLKVYFVDSSIRISRFPEVLNFNQVFLKLNHFFLDLTYWPVPPCSSGAKIRKIDLSSVLKPGFHRDSQYFNRIFSIFNLNMGNILWNIVSPEEYYYGS